MNREQLIEEIHEMFDGFTLKETAIERFMSAVDKYSQYQTDIIITEHEHRIKEDESTYRALSEENYHVIKSLQKLENKCDLYEKIIQKLVK